MAKINLIKNNFTSGELSKKIWLRTDLQQYRNGLKEAFNVLPIIEGGIRKRAGTQAIAQVADAVRILPFTLSHTDTFILVFKPNQIDILNPEGTTIKSLSTPYSATDIRELNYCQNRHQFFIAHANHPLKWLRTSEDLTNWAIDDFQFAVPPLEETDTPAIAIKPSEKAAGKKAVVTASLYEAYDNTKRYLVNDICWYVIEGVRYYFKAIKITQGNAPTLGTQMVDEILEDKNWSPTAVTSADAFTAADVNKFMFVNEGIIRIDEFLDRSTVRGEILLKLSTDIEAIANSWSFKQNIFTESLGFAKAVSMYQQRLVLAGTKGYPNYVWLSRVGDVTNFLPTTTDGDSFTVSASSDQLTNVLHLAQSRGIVVFTGGSEQSISATNTLTPTNANITEATAYGITENIRPIKVGSELLFIQKSAERLRTLSYDYSVDTLVSNELTVLSSHIAKEHGGFKEMVYQAEPDSIIWFVMGDGTVASLTLNREQSVNSFSRHDIGGTVLSTTVLPSASGADRLYFLVNRNGTTQLEQMEEGLLLDSVVKATVQHNKPCIVENPLIGILGDDIAAYYVDGIHTYSLPIIKREGNTLTIDCEMTVGEIFIGRKFTARISLFPPEIQGAPMTSSPSLFKINYINLYMYESINPKVNGEIVELKQFTDNVFEPPKPYTGNKRIEMNGWSDFDNFRLVIEQDEPLPFAITAVVLEHNFNDR
jgi:hypothetical protein